MRAALAVNRVTSDVDANLAGIIDMAGQAAAAGAELVLFPEAALTGLVNEDDPVHDLPLGQTVPGPITRELGDAARRLGVYLAIGLLEKEGACLYDSAILLTPAGEIGLKYRRIHPGWHGRHADPAVYHEGASLAVARTDLGLLTCLICGDLFDDGIVERARDLQPDFVLYPFARCFDGGSWSQERWDTQERAVYIGRAAMLGAPVLMANYLARPELLGGAFGGAMVVSAAGKVLAEWPLGRPGVLVVDVDPSATCGSAIGGISWPYAP